MDRRQLLQAINTFGLGAVLPTSVRNELRAGVVAVGGAGGKVLRHITGKLPDNCRTVAINTDVSAWHRIKVDRKIRVGDIPDRPVRSDAARRLVVRRFARAAIPRITEAVAGLDMVLLVAGMGGVAGTVMSPVVARVLREQNIFTLGLPILPFEWEGQRRGDIARYGASELGRHVHSLIPISNEALALAEGENATIQDVFNQASLAVLRHYQSVTHKAEATLFSHEFRSYKCQMY